MKKAKVRDWTSFVEGNINIEELYAEGLVRMAANKADTDKFDGPMDTDDPKGILLAVTKKDAPPWWPTRLDRVDVRIRIAPERGDQSYTPPALIDPAARGIGLPAFVATIRNLCNGIGIPFEGQIGIELRNRSTSEILATRSFNPIVGVGRTAEEDDERAQRDYAWKRVDQMAEHYDKLASQLPGVVNAAANVITAMRHGKIEGEEEEKEEDLLTKILKVGAEVAIESGLIGGGEDTKKAGKKLLASSDQRKAITDKTGHILDSDEVLEEKEGAFDGSENFDEDVVVEEEEESERPSRKDEEEEEEDDEPSSSSQKNPLIGKGPDQVGAWLEEWIEKSGVTKKEVMSIGKKLWKLL